ncbi:MAG: glutamate mutase L [Candidatus Cloacimonetes bacterium]|nr:glutamate mutase L [Candidatus Cloacimonadota bacterium]
MLKNNIIITDIGSTTTKALWLQKEDNSYRLKDYQSAYTTVEKPDEDVKVGIYNSIRKLEQNGDTAILSPTAQVDNLAFLEGFSYLTTSSAGGGLQILVIGLTKCDSAASAERAAFGVGGVLIDTIAIDDKRSTFEQMQIFNAAHPDIILFCGGIDGGALFSVYRIAERLKLANPNQKFSTGNKLPLVYAGNKDATDYINTIFSKMFDLHFVPNLRPSMQEENLEPTKEKIHNLFMENVMEQAPGYAKVKKIVDADIIPTPSGVLQSLKILGKKYQKVIAFDIGGATTDIFSNIDDRFHRSVSANFGMSYSIGNVLTECDFEKDIVPYLNLLAGQPMSAHRDEYQNYIGNKILYPGNNPQIEKHKFYEHITAISAIRLSIKQHFNMHFQRKRIGFLDNLKQLAHRDKWKEHMFYPHYDKSFIFSMSDIEIVIGAGGVISNATEKQAILMIIESVELQGITELWRDRLFISPHLGVLATVSETCAEELLLNDCYERLCLYIRPKILHSSKQANVMTVSIEGEEFKLKTNEVFYYMPDKDTQVRFSFETNISLEKNSVDIKAKIPLLIDTRDLVSTNSKKVLLEALRPYESLESSIPQSYVFADFTLNDFIIRDCVFDYSLPYKGTILVKEKDRITPNLLLGENLFEPPKVYVLLISAILQRTISEEEIRKYLVIKENDKTFLYNLHKFCIQPDPDGKEKLQSQKPHHQGPENNRRQ